MDLSFGRNALDMTSAVAVRLDYPGLVAILASAQAASPTARTESLIARDSGVANTPLAALVRLMDPQAGWVAAGGPLGGSFHPEIAERCRKRS
jgi:hypothetical protein